MQLNHKNVRDYIRFVVASPFSKAYRGRLKWLREESFWHAKGIAAHDIRRKFLLVPGNRAVFVAISKVANTSLSLAFATNPAACHANVHKKKYSPMRLVDSGKTLSDLTDGTTRVFTFVRDPVDRFWSAYTDKIINKGRTSPMARKIRTCLKLTDSAPIAPADVLKYLQATPTIMQDEHLRPQWSCTAVEYLPYAYIGRLETMDQDLKALISRGLLGREHVDKITVSNKSQSATVKMTGKLSDDIRDYYAKDMACFGYS